MKPSTFRYVKGDGHGVVISVWFDPFPMTHEVMLTCREWQQPVRYSAEEWPDAEAAIVRVAQALVANGYAMEEFQMGENPCSNLT